MPKVNWEIEKGHLGAEPEISTIKGGKLMAKVSIANNRYIKDDDGEWEQLGITSWIQATAFGYVAEIIEALELEKGDAVYATGHMYQTEWEDEDGYDVVSWDFIIDKLFPIPQVFEEDEEERSGHKKKRRRGRRTGSKKKKKKGRSRLKKGKRSPKISGKKKSKSDKSDLAKRVMSQMRG